MKTWLFLAFMVTTAAAGEYRAIVEAVIDGDTLIVKDKDGKNTTIRLYGVDAPENGQAGGDDATAALVTMIGTAEITVSAVYRDDYRRTVAIVYVGEEPVNARILEAGNAWLYPQFCKKPICEEWNRIEQEAQAARRGLWREYNPTPPWKWRREKRKKQETKGKNEPKISKNQKR